MHRVLLGFLVARVVGCGVSEEADVDASAQHSQTLPFTGTAPQLAGEPLLVSIQPSVPEPAPEPVLDFEQTPRSPRRNGLPMKLIDGALVMRHEHLTGAVI
jgi:hypothetical protein